MFKKIFIAFCLILALSLLGCAKRGSITGGLKDTLPPVLKSSFPKNFTTNFTAKEINLTFDEYIKLKDMSKQLVISPPMKNEPLILPTNATKFLKIEIKDTLQPNTTYSFNFGQSITDNNEGNALNQFKYVFSTGSYIDSLSLAGTIKDAYNKEFDNFVSIMLYEMDDKYTDSIVYNQMPRYITNTLDSMKTFKLENLKAGKYMLVALKDANKNNKFNSKEDKIGFIKQAITIPNDTLYELELFKETIPFKAYKPTQASGNRLFLGYDGTQNFKLSKPTVVLKRGSEILPTIITQMPKKDSLQIWYKPLKNDSLSIEIKKDQYAKDYSFKIRDQNKKDTLNVSTLQSGTIGFNDRFTLDASTPLVTIDKTKMRLINNAKEEVPFETEQDIFNQKLYFDFKKEPAEKYSLTLLPGALTDFFDEKSDTLTYKFDTKPLDQVGNLKIQLQNVKKFPVIVELTNDAGDVKASKYTSGETVINFNLIEPSLYTLRIIYDDNKNEQYDTGSFLEKRYSEEVVYYSKQIDVRINWDVEQSFDVSLPYIPEPKDKTGKKNEKGAKPANRKPELN
ncbi:Ig-like domain-containing protein [Flavobacterium algicola]|uniref:Ig-like domain-containing protein n=1 Tax=Flavobacterium algicola TaxID=556529 RepID=UPI001EFCF9D5|nr:Ig-like domain-containing protein [Flavobacterium algicola]MCG9792157.1 Ig-like domain-containing protein [Flavobacterium algicola]